MWLLSRLALLTLHIHTITDYLLTHYLLFFLRLTSCSPFFLLLACDDDFLIFFVLITAYAMYFIALCIAFAFGFLRLTSNFSLLVFITVVIIATVIEHLASRGGLRALEGRRACDGVFVLGTCAQRTP